MGAANMPRPTELRSYQVDGPPLPRFVISATDLRREVEYNARGARGDFITSSSDDQGKHTQLGPVRECGTLRRVDALSICIMLKIWSLRMSFY